MQVDYFPSKKTEFRVSCHMMCLAYFLVRALVALNVYVFIFCFSDITASYVILSYKHRSDHSVFAPWIITLDQEASYSSPGCYRPHRLDEGGDESGP